MIQITEQLRLRRYDNECEFALKWYQDRELLDLVDGKDSQPYTMKKLRDMYSYLDHKGELYFIEIEKEGVFIAIGDVTFSENDMPIVIGEKGYRGIGIGTQVIQALKKRAYQLGYRQLNIREIYDYNKASQKLFEREGFKINKKTEKGYSYTCIL